MIQVAGRPMFAALHMLLCGDRMFSLGDKQRLPAILENSRKYQNTVSTALAEQVLAALYELMRGFQAANDVRKGELLRDVLANDPNHVYSGLLTVLLRLVFVMYAEDRDLLFQRSCLLELLFGDRSVQSAAERCWAVPGHDGPAFRLMVSVDHVISFDLRRWSAQRLQAAITKGLPVRSRPLSVSGRTPARHRREQSARGSPESPMALSFESFRTC